MAARIRRDRAGGAGLSDLEGAGGVLTGFMGYKARSMAGFQIET